MKVSVPTVLLFLGLSLIGAAFAQVPPLVTYQGGVAVGGTAFHGIGYFKFAFVSRDGGQTFWSNDGTSLAGAEPEKALPLVVYRGSYEVILGDTTVTNMLPVPPTVFTNPAVHLRVWFSDGTGAFQKIEPDMPVTSVGYAMVASTVPDGAIGAAKLAEGAVTAGKLAANAVTALNVAPGSIGPAHLAANAAALNLQASGGLILSDQANATNLEQAGFTKVGTVLADSDRWQRFMPYDPTPRTNAVAGWIGSGLLIWGGQGYMGKVPRDAARYDLATETWTSVAVTNPPPAGTKSEAIWTGSELIIIANQPAFSRRYDPANDTWRAISPLHLEFNGQKPLLFWTGSEVLVWAGLAGSRYDPIHDVWTPMAPPSLAGVVTSAGVWTGTEMILWGGSGTTAGARYQPASNSWRPLSRTNAPAARVNFTAVWDGTEMLVWGGQTTTSSTAPRLNTGGRYNPTADTWRPISTSNVLARSGHAAAWTGTDMLVFGGTGVEPNRPRVMTLDGGARYNPKTDTWQPISTRGMPATRLGMATVWTGNELYVWGGSTLFNGVVTQPFANDGWRYQPATDTWRPLAGVPIGRSGHSAVWTGMEMIIWGGNPNLVTMADSGMNSGARFNPVTTRWYPIASANAPTPRWNHRAVWTGREMIVWGGEGIPANSPETTPRSATLNTGACYDPVSDTWRAMDTNGAPRGRSEHSLVWTGVEVVVFGGRSNIVGIGAFSGINTGGRYQPQTDSWATMTALGAPAAREAHAACWTGKEMMVWGGTGTNATGGLVPLATGARYNPVLNAWSAMADSPAEVTGIAAGVWTDRAFLVWSRYGRGARYDPGFDQWTPIAPGGPVSTLTQGAVWTGKEMLVWSPMTSPGASPGARYQPAPDAWTWMTRESAPRFLRQAPGVWTGDTLLAFGVVGTGGTAQNLATNATVSYTLTRPLSLYRYAGGLGKAGQAAPVPVAPHEQR